MMWLWIILGVLTIVAGYVLWRDLGKVTKKKKGRLPK